MKKISIGALLSEFRVRQSRSDEDPLERTIRAVWGAKDACRDCHVEIAHEEGDEFLKDVFDSAYGKGISDEDKALILSCAALLGHANSMHDLGWCFHFGKGVARDYELAIYWHTQAAERGDGYAMQNLGKIFTEEGSPVWDGPRGIAWFEKAVAQGDVYAKGDLAHCLLCGKCVAKDEGRAEALLMEAVRFNPDREDWQEDLRKCPLEPGMIRNARGQKMRQIDVDFYKACQGGTVEELKELIARGANPNAPWYNDIGDDFYPIHQAALNPDLEVLRYVVSTGAGPCQKDFWSAEPLAYAVRQGSLEKVRYLVGLGNDPAREDMDGQTVIKNAALNPNVDVLDFLLENGADLNEGAWGEGALPTAVCHGTPERVKYFLDHGADMSDIDEFDLQSAPIENLRVLFEYGYDVYGFDEHGEKRLIDHLNPERRTKVEELLAAVKRSKCGR